MLMLTLIFLFDSLKGHFDSYPYLVNFSEAPDDFFNSNDSFKYHPSTNNIQLVDIAAILFEAKWILSSTETT